jgi:type IV secretion system protein VirB1
MILEIATVVALARQCAPSVAVETLVSVVHTESHFNPYAIGVNAKGVPAPNPSDRASAAEAARSLIARGYNIDLGLGQINSANLRWLGLSVENAFDPCRNLAAAARVLASNYLSVSRSSPSTEVAIATAVSMYNTGSRSRGFGNGYVSRVYASSSVVVPAIRSGGVWVAEALPAGAKGSATPAPAPSQITKVGWDTSAGAQTATLMVFGGASSNSPKGQVE